MLSSSTLEQQGHFHLPSFPGSKPSSANLQQQLVQQSAASALAQHQQHQQQQQQQSSSAQQSPHQQQISATAHVIQTAATSATMSMREPKPFKCPHCVKSFANNSYLSQHMRIHLGIRAFGPCQFCGKKFTQLSHLQQHIRTHTGEKPYKCKFGNCEKAFSQLSNLQSHSRCHQADRPYKCNSCYKCFADEATLLEHIPKHKESKHLKIHICPYCGKSYTQALYLDKHMTKHADRRNDLRFPKNYYNGGSVGDFMSDNFESLNSLGTLQNDDLTLKFLQQQQQQQQFVNAAAAASTSPYSSNGSISASAATGAGSSLLQSAYSNISPSTFSSSVAGNSSMSMMNNMTNQMIGNIFQRSLRLGGESTGLRNNSDRIATGFSMITPLDQIKHFNQSSASSSNNFQ